MKPKDQQSIFPFEKDLINQLKQLEADLMSEVRRLQTELDQVDALEENKRSALKKQIQVQSAKHKSLFVNFALQHPNSHLGMDLLYRNRKNISESQLKAVYQKLEPTYREGPNGRALNIFLTEQLIKKGAKCIEIEAQTVDHKPFKLSDYLGKFILLIFWSSNCSAANQLNELLSKNYAKCPEDLEIISFSMNQHVEQWMAASKSGGIIWHNISDLAGPNGRIKTLYNVQAIPTLFFIDRAGIVVDIQKGFSNDLMDHLAQWTKK